MIGLLSCLIQKLNGAERKKSIISMSVLSSGRWVVVMIFNTNKTDLHVIIKILLKVVLNIKKLNLT